MGTKTNGFEQNNISVGGLVTGVLIGVAFQQGYIAAIVGIAMIYPAYKGYTILAGGKDKKGIVIATVISVIALFLVCGLRWGLDLYNNMLAAGYELTYMDALFSLPSLLASDSERMVFFIKYLAIEYVAMAVCSFTIIKHLVKQVDMPENSSQLKIRTVVSSEEEQ